MCGIAGWLARSHTPPDAQSRLEKMRDALRHRGPDGDGIELFDLAGLAHTRLSIIDLDNGQQPMMTADRRYTISFNGEIYNYRSLRQQLQERGVQFRSDSDTEVVLQLLVTEGTAGFDRMRGMFAFAIWDEIEKRAWLVRDTLGIKPLFYCEDAQGNLWFASEAKALRAAQVAGGLNTSALHLLMNFRYVPGDDSLFEGVQQLAPGAVLHWQAREGLHLEQIPAGDSGSDKLDVISELRDSVKAHLTADVEVGVYLSGGIDSALITALAARESSSPLRSFTVDAGDDPAEAANAARTAELLGVQNLQMACDSQQMSLAKVLWHVEAPKVNALQVGLLAQQAASQVKVVLSGLGGDELFLGYNLHRLIRSLKISTLIPSPLRQLAAMPAPMLSRIAGVPFCEAQRALAAFGLAGDWPAAYGLLRNVWDTHLPRAQVYAERMLATPLPGAMDVLRDAWPRREDPMQAVAEYEWQHKMVNDLLWQEDRMSMACGLEVRVPFVDRHMAKLSQSMDTATLMPDGRAKGLLKREALKILPGEVIDRPKSGFQVDAGEFVSTELAGWLRCFMNEEYVRKQALFKPAFVAQVMRAPRTKTWRWHWFMLYLMLGAHLWVELFENNRSVADLESQVAAA